MITSMVQGAPVPVTHLTLSNHVINVDITPDIGGRLLGFSLQGRDNFLLVGDAVAENSAPVVSPQSGHMPYMGHEMWVGPQSEWWVHQLLNAERNEQRAVWPPDPYLVLAKNQRVLESNSQIVLRSPNSPISGVVMEKTYSLVASNPNQLQLDVSVQNIRDTDVRWDTWFNTRVTPATQVYVPVASEQDLRVNNIEDEIHGPLAYDLSQGIFHLDSQSVPSNKLGRKGKLLIQPSHGWIAAFRAKQLFVIQFTHQSYASIHPEQGQVELYLEYPMTEVSAGVLELEVHAPYKTLKPSGIMQAQELWTLLPYEGEDSPAAHRAFLRVQAKTLGLGGF